MAQPRPHWSLYLAIAAFAGYFLLAAVHGLYPPGTAGVTATFVGPFVFVGHVEPQSRAGRAGIRSGDRIEAVDGVRLADYIGLRVLGANARVGDVHAWTFARQDGSGYTVSLTTPPRAVAVSWSQPFAGVVTFILLISLILAAITALQRPRDPTALLGAFVLGALALVTEPLGPRGMAAAWRSLPPPIAVLLFVPCFASLFVTQMFFLFTTRFPRPLRRAWVPWLMIAPSLIIVAVIARLFILTVYDPAGALGMAFPAWLRVAGPLGVAGYVPAGCLVLVWRYRTTTDVTDRRRLRVLILGALGGTVGLILIALRIVIRATGSTDQVIASSMIFSSMGYVIAAILFLFLPLSFHYAILQHRLLDIRIIIRQGLQYAFARGALLSIVPVAGAALLADLLLHGDEPFGRIVRVRGWVYAGVMGAAAIAHARRGVWLRALDRRFFRDRYEAANILRAVVADVRSRATIEAAAAPVVARIEQALHPHFVALLTSSEPREPLTTLAVSPASAPCVSLPAGGTVRRLVSVLEKPLPVGGSDSGWLTAQLSENEAAALASTGIELVVPVAAARGEILLALGAKRSEEPYTAEDLGLLSAIAEGLALLGAGAPAPAEREPTLVECPECGACYDSGPAVCPRDGAALTATTLPRALAGRYVLQRRLGRGGMGTVYEAQDSALKRQVAVKVVRDDLLGSADAINRFEQEALSAAAFAHPHVVTVHDYGTVGARAFLVMERLHGLSLREALAHGRLDPAQTAMIVEGVSSAIEAAHARRMIHRDLKPENIFLVNDRSRVKVLDFGIAKFLPDVMTVSGTTGPGILVGTMQYMAPEQLSGGAPAPSWDIWALGVITYEMVIGSHPFAGVPPLEWGAALLARRFRAPSSVVPGLKGEWDGFFARALHPDPAERIASARAFAAAAATV